MNQQQVVSQPPIVITEAIKNEGDFDNFPEIT